MIWVEFVFMMLVLKLPIVYVCWIVWWAVRQTPLPPEGASVAAAADDDAPRGWWRSSSRRRRPRGPHGRPARSYPRAATARARAKVQR